MAYDSPKMPLPMMALLKLNVDIPKDVVPGCCWKQQKKIAINLCFNDGNVKLLFS